MPQKQWIQRIQARKVQRLWLQVFLKWSRQSGHKKFKLENSRPPIHQEGRGEEAKEVGPENPSNEVSNTLRLSDIKITELLQKIPRYLEHLFDFNPVELDKFTSFHVSVLLSVM